MLNEILSENTDKEIVIGTHGTALSTILDVKKLTEPDVLKCLRDDETKELLEANNVTQLGI